MKDHILYLCIKKSFSSTLHQVALSVTRSSCSRTRVSTQTCKRSPQAISSTMITMRSICEQWQWQLYRPLWLQWGQPVKNDNDTLEWWLQRGQADWLHDAYYDLIIHYDSNEVKKISHFRSTQALDNVTNNKVVMAEARQWLDFIIRQAMKLIRK